MFVYFATSQLQTPSLGWLIFKTLLILAVFGVVIFLFFKYGGKWLRFPYLQKHKRGKMEIKGVLPLQPRKTLFLVKVQNKNILIGASESKLSLLAKFDEEKTTFDKEGEF
ncbi:MAG: flagellar biosynthetic protein FliO [Myxococcota bacterium]